MTINECHERNKIVKVTKTDAGSLIAVNGAGQSFEIKKDDELFQVYAVYCMLLNAGA
jgi:hypothetical protein